MPIPSGGDVYLGRGADLELLTQTIEAARESSGSLLLVSGDAGMGKTRFAEEATRRARAAGFVVGWGRCADAEGAPPYLPWTQVLRELTVDSPRTPVPDWRTPAQAPWWCVTAGRMAAVRSSLRARQLTKWALNDIVRDEMFVTNDIPEVDAEKAAREISRLYGEMWRRFNPPKQPIVGSDVTPRMLAVLRHLAGVGPLTVGELAIHLGIGRATATEMVDRLERKGLIERMRDERDQRRVFTWLTVDGRRRVETMSKSVLDDPFVKAVEAIPPETRRQIIDGLSALLGAAGAGAIHNQEAR